MCLRQWRHSEASLIHFLFLVGGEKLALVVRSTLTLLFWLLIAGDTVGHYGPLL